MTLGGAAWADGPGAAGVERTTRQADRVRRRVTGTGPFDPGRTRPVGPCRARRASAWITCARDNPRDGGGGVRGLASLGGSGAVAGRQSCPGAAAVRARRGGGRGESRAGALASGERGLRER